MSDVHYFPRYSQPENFATNNTLLLLLRLNQYNRFKFERFLDALFADAGIEFAKPGLYFQQQKGTGASVLDGFIAQDSFKIAVETKSGKWFDPIQLEHHLQVFRSEQHKVLILLSPSEEGLVDGALRTFREGASRKGVQVIHVSFEDIIKKSRACLSDHDEEMLALVADYESFCSSRGLLPRDRYTLFVPPCSQSFEDNVTHALYYCPETWTRRNSAYLGIYADKAVRKIGRIKRIVACDVDLNTGSVTGADLSAPELTTKEEERIVGAARMARTRGWDLSAGHKFFLCDELFDTDFRKESPGGIQGHRYFDLEEVLGGKVPESLSELAALLSHRPWP